MTSDHTREPQEIRNFRLVPRPKAVETRSAETRSAATPNARAAAALALNTHAKEIDVSREQELDRQLFEAEATIAEIRATQAKRGSHPVVFDRVEHENMLIRERRRWAEAYSARGAAERALRVFTEARATEERTASVKRAEEYRINAILHRDALDDIDVSQRASPQILRIAAKHAVSNSKRMTATQQARVERMIDGEGVDDPVQLSRMIVATGSPAYHRAWAGALVTGNAFLADSEQKRALHRESETRAASEGTNSGGGYGVPFDLDSQIIGTAGGQVAPVLDLCRTVTLTQGDSWHGVSSPLTSGFGWVTEAGTFTDNSLTIGQPTLPIFKMGAVIPVSYELLEDYGGEGFQSEMQRILADEYLSFMGNATLNATGSSQPSGIFTQLYNTTTNPAHVVVSGVPGSLGLADVRNAWKALGSDKFRSNSVWIMHPSTLSQIEQSVSGGASLSEFRYSDDGVAHLHGRPVVESLYAPQWTGTTSSSAQIFALVDLRDGFLVANRVPTIVELTQSAQLPNVVPTMQKFIITSPRVGFGLLDPLFGIILAGS